MSIMTPLGKGKQPDQNVCSPRSLHGQLAIGCVGGTCERGAHFCELKIPTSAMQPRMVAWTLEPPPASREKQSSQWTSAQDTSAGDSAPEACSRWVVGVFRLLASWARWTLIGGTLRLVGIAALQRLCMVAGGEAAVAARWLWGYE